KNFSNIEIKKMFDSLKQQSYLKNESWFSIDFIIQNNVNIEKITRKWMKWKYNKTTNEVEVHKPRESSMQKKRRRDAKLLESN
ncbi:MAG: hypothetical protein U9N34_09710, partial [Candidatus Cloacimonadota bacterium]|nr:hypothetical protein [Candidatus Cloacimonadota bacterium]